MQGGEAGENPTRAGAPLQNEPTRRSNPKRQLRRGDHAHFDTSGGYSAVSGRPPVVPRLSVAMGRVRKGERGFPAPDPGLAAGRAEVGTWRRPRSRTKCAEYALPFRDAPNIRTTGTEAVSIVVLHGPNGCTSVTPQHDDVTWTASRLRPHRLLAQSRGKNRYERGRALSHIPYYTRDFPS